VLIARDPARAEATTRKLAGSGHETIIADLSLLSGMRRAAEAVAGEVDVLINNAGALFSRRELTADGLEKTFAVNHMAYFVVTTLLLPRMKQGARIVSTASDAHRGARLDFDDLQSEKRYSGFSVYGKSKLMNILFTRELARRIGGTGVTANCLHPGFVATRFGDSSGGLFQTVIGLGKSTVALTPEKGAQTIIYLASSPEVEGKSGGYYVKKKLATPTREAQSGADARRLWDVSAKIAHVG
jgi:NAD(P)-dependent dehydrogenase (short-subunit alcohol dehydrogenase family)